MDSIRAVDPRPTATANLEPVGLRGDTPRRYAVRLRLPLSNFDARLANRGGVTSVAQSALAPLGHGVAASVSDVVGTKDRLIAIEAAIVHSDRLDAEAIGRLRETLSSAGYNVAIRELRECGNDACAMTAPMDASRRDAAPAGWFSAEVCGRHGFRSCVACKSVYLMTSTNAAGQAPSVHCEVCGAILVEWGGTKLWTVELVTRGGPSAS
jgi:hypothetical protein